MQKWEYAHAIYKDGVLDPHIEEGLAHVTNRSVNQFLYEAGQNGWELCAALPYPTTKEPDGTLAVIFKRPVLIKAKAVVERRGLRRLSAWT